MALTPQNDEAFLREVDDELRREQLTTLWQRYGRIGIGLIVLVLIIFAGVLWWRGEAAKKADARGEQMSAAIADIQANRSGCPGEADRPGARQRRLSCRRDIRQGGFGGRWRRQEGRGGALCRHRRG